MPRPARSDIEIAQRACTMAGIAKPSSFDDSDNEVAVALNDLYEDIVGDCLTIHPWRFATFQVPLGPPLGTAPIAGFSQAYALPADPPVLQLRTVFIGGSLVSRYQVMGQQIWLDATTTDKLAVEALFRLNESQWPPWFVLYAILKLAGFLAGSITRNGALAQALLNEGERQLARSRTRDSQQQTTTGIRLTKMRSTRLGGRPL